MPFYIYNKDKSVKIRCKSPSDPKAQKFLGWSSNYIYLRFRDKKCSTWFLIDDKGPYYLEADGETAPQRAKRLGRNFKADYIKAKEKMEHLTSQNQQYRDQDQEPGERHWEYFQNFLDTVNSWVEYKLVITPKVKCQYVWYRYQNKPANGLPSLSNTTRYLVPITEVDEMTRIANKAEASLSPDVFNFALPILALGMYDNRSKIAKAIASYLSLQSGSEFNNQTEHSTKISKTKPKEVVSFIPELEQFPTSLTESGLTYKDFLIWLYGAAEQDLMALHIGRSASLPQGGIMAGESEPVEHSYRNVLILKSQPLLGKSWFNNWLISGLEGCGLITSVIHDLGRQFGHAVWVSSAWSYLDDTTETMIQHFFNSAILKTVASNGLVNVESKGVDHMTVKAFTTPILLANNIDSRHLANCDEGNANRIKIICTKSTTSLPGVASELEPCSPLYGIDTCTPARVSEFLCQKLGVEAEVLSMYFIRLCLDYFESFTRDSMNDKISRASHELYANYTTNGINVLAQAAVLSYFLKYGVGKKERNELKTKFTGAGNSAPFILASLETLADLSVRTTAETCGVLKGVIKKHWVENNKPPSHPWVAFRNYSTYFLCKIGLLASTYEDDLTRQGKDFVSLDKIYQAVFSELKDVRGNPSVYSISRIQEAWNSALILNADYIESIYLYVGKTLTESKKSSELIPYRNSGSLLSEYYKKISTLETNPIIEIPDDYFLHTEPDQIPEFD
jgi:hypothetical protein